MMKQKSFMHIIVIYNTFLLQLVLCNLQIVSTPPRETKGSSDSNEIINTTKISSYQGSQTSPHLRSTTPVSRDYLVLQIPSIPSSVSQSVSSSRPLSNPSHVPLFLSSSNSPNTSILKSSQISLNSPVSEEFQYPPVTPPLQSSTIISTTPKAKKLSQRLTASQIANLSRVGPFSEILYNSQQVSRASTASQVECGFAPNYRVVGGRKSIPQIWPWVVTVRTYKGYTFCGGTLITYRHVLSAAHCVDQIAKRKASRLLRIGLSVFQRSGGTDSLFKVSHIDVHPQFGSTSPFANDLALLSLFEDVPYFGKPICIPSGRSELNYLLDSGMSFNGGNSMEKETETDLFETIVGNLEQPSREVTNSDNSDKFEDEKVVRPTHLTQNCTYHNTECLEITKESPQNTLESSAHSANFQEHFRSFQESSRHYLDKEKDLTDSMKDLNLGRFSFYPFPETTEPPFEIIPGKHRKSAVVVGWGRMQEYGGPSEFLQEAFIQVLNRSICHQAYGSTFEIDTMLCGGSTEGGIDACQGDSGGALMILDHREIWYIIGTVSFGLGCGDSQFPGVYTSVSDYGDWISSITGV